MRYRCPGAGRPGRDETPPLTGVQLTDPTTPLVFSLDQNYPNPFNPTTTIAFSIAKKGPVKMQLFDIDGRLLKTLVDEDMAPGTMRFFP